MTLKEFLILSVMTAVLGWFLVAIFRNTTRHLAHRPAVRMAVFAGALGAVGLAIWLAVLLGASPRAFLPRH